VIPQLLKRLGRPLPALDHSSGELLVELPFGIGGLPWPAQSRQKEIEIREVAATGRIKGRHLLLQERLQLRVSFARKHAPSEIGVEPSPFFVALLSSRSHQESLS